MKRNKPTILNVTIVYFGEGLFHHNMTRPDGCTTASAGAATSQGRLIEAINREIKDMVNSHEEDE